MPVRPDSLAPEQKRRHLDALEALFTPKPPVATPAAPSTRSLAKIVSASKTAPDPARTRLVAGLLAAEGGEPVRRAVAALERAGIAVPREQEAQLRMLQHPDERRVRAAMGTLAQLFEVETPRRRTVIEGRLRHLEDLADDSETRELATALRKRVHRAEA